MARGHTIALFRGTDTGTYPDHLAVAAPIVARLGDAYQDNGARTGSHTGTAPCASNMTNPQAAPALYHPEHCAEAKALRMSAFNSFQSNTEEAE